MLLFAIILAVIAILFVLAVRCNERKGIMDAFYGWNYAHRGLYGNGIPENSLKAFKAAKEAGYGVELDVHLLKDGALAVIHDSKLLRMTGREGIVEDLTAQQLTECFLNGTDQTIPLFSDVLQLYDGKAPLIVELKPVGDNVAALCSKTCEMLDGYKGLYCLESFDPRCVYWLKINRPDLIRGQLYKNYFKDKSSPLTWILKFMLRHQLCNFLTLPDFVAYQYPDRKTVSNYIVRKIWNVPSVSWTLKSIHEYNTAIAEGCIPIFENFMP